MICDVCTHQMVTVSTVSLFQSKPYRTWLVNYYTKRPRYNWVPKIVSYNDIDQKLVANLYYMKRYLRKIVHKYALLSSVLCSDIAQKIGMIYCELFTTYIPARLRI